MRSNFGRLLREIRGRPNRPKELAYVIARRIAKQLFMLSPWHLAQIVCAGRAISARSNLESQEGMSNRLQVKKNRRFPSFFRLDVPLFWRFAAEVGVTKDLRDRRRQVGLKSLGERSVSTGAGKRMVTSDSQTPDHEKDRPPRQNQVREGLLRQPCFSDVGCQSSLVFNLRLDQRPTIFSCSRRRTPPPARPKAGVAYQARAR